MRWFAPFALAVLLALPATASDADDVRQEISEAWEAIADYSADQKDAAVERGEELMDNLDERIDQLAEEASEAKGEAKAAAEERLEDLKHLRADAADRLEKLRESGTERWDDFKAAFGDAVAAFRDRMSSE